MATGAGELVSVFGRLGLSSAASTQGGPGGHGGHGVTVVSPPATETNRYGMPVRAVERPVLVLVKGSGG
jgi:hypothetical protein